MKYYRTISLLMAVIFAVVGLIFLFFADGVLEFFNALAALAGMKLSPLRGVDFYLILASGYMYLVTLLACLMFRHPTNAVFPLLLAQAKLASSVLSFGFFILQQPYLIYLTNGIVDGLIGLVVLYFYLQIKKRQS
jgi:hypothetical protein